MVRVDLLLGCQSPILVIAISRRFSAAIDKRELRALLDAGEVHPKARKRLLTLTRDGKPAAAPPGVTVQPAYEWLLAAPGAD